MVRVSASCCFCSSVPVQVMVRASPASSNSSLRILKTSPNLAARPRKACAVSLLMPRQARTVLAEFGQGRHAVVDGDHAAAGQQSNRKLCHLLRRGKCAVGCIGHPLHHLCGVSRPVQQHRRGNEGRAFETMATTGAIQARHDRRRAHPSHLCRNRPRPPKPRATEAGSTKPGATEAGSTEAAEKSATRHRCCFLSIKLSTSLIPSAAGMSTKLRVDRGNRLARQRLLCPLLMPEMDRRAW